MEKGKVKKEIVGSGCVDAAVQLNILIKDNKINGGK